MLHFLRRASRLTDSLLPSAELILEHSGGVSPQQFIEMGDEVVRHSLIGHGKLPKDGSILDIGCGCGKIARPLTRYLSPAGVYHGIDITQAAIGWCREAYKPFPNFHFHLADLSSARYNTTGGTNAASYRLPFDNDRFDLVFLGSVFTHLLPAEVENYLNEIFRVLRSNGKCLATFFVVDSEASTNIREKRTTPRFGYDHGHDGCRVERLDIPEAAIAYEEMYIRSLYKKAGLSIESVNFGHWGRGKLIPHWQDEIWSSKA